MTAMTDLIKDLEAVTEGSKVIGVDQASGPDMQTWIEARRNPDGSFTVERCLSVVPPALRARSTEDE